MIKNFYLKYAKYYIEIILKYKIIFSWYLGQNRINLFYFAVTIATQLVASFY